MLLFLAQNWSHWLGMTSNFTVRQIVLIFQIFDRIFDGQNSRQCKTRLEIMYEFTWIINPHRAVFGFYILLVYFNRVPNSWILLPSLGLRFGVHGILCKMRDCSKHWKKILNFKIDRALGLSWMYRIWVFCTIWLCLIIFD